MRFQITAEDLAKGKLVTPGWMAVELLKAEDVTSKNENKVKGVKVTAKVIGGKEEDRGTTLYTQFWENAPGFSVNFLAALGIKVEAGKEYEINTNNIKGRKMDWFINRGDYKGKPQNNVDDYRPLEAAA